ncbi:MAG TPA: PASTA domain-containing protein [Acidobacteriaceae bacterium]|nr:PASTA domain-containing protein [Acidobacteriaceae bacterium]
MTGFFRFVLLLLLLVVVAMTSAILTMHFAIHGAEVSIPDFKGMTMADAGQRASAQGLTLQVESHLYSTGVPLGRVASQSPEPGTLVRRGWRVWLTESLGPQKLAIPDVKGKDQRFATIAIRRAGFQVGNVAEIPWTGAQPGTVIAQSPDANAAGVESPTMNLLVAAEPGPGTPESSGFVMPNFEGQLFTAAALAVTRIGLKLGPVREQDMHGVAAGPAGPVVPPGTVVGQSPAAGDRVDATMTIQLTVAK